MCGHFQDRLGLLAADGGELIHDQHDLFGDGVEFVAEGFDDGGEIEPGAPFAHQCVTLSKQRRVEHEHVASSGATVLEVASGQSARLGRQRRAGVGDQLAARFIQADERTGRVNGLGVNLQHVLSASDGGGAGLGRDDPLLPQPRLERVFLSVWRTVSCEQAATTSKTTSRSARSRNVQRAWPWGGVEQARATKGAWA